MFKKHTNMVSFQHYCILFTAGYLGFMYKAGGVQQIGRNVQSF